MDQRSGKPQLNPAIEALLDRIQRRLDVLGISERRACLEAGLSTAYVKNIREGKSKSPKTNELSRLAYALGTSLEWLVSGAGMEDIREATLVERTAPDSFSPATMPARGLVGIKDLPVYAAAMGGKGHQIVTFDAIDFVKRPALLENVRDAYAIYIVSDSMVPAFEPGDLALVNPHLPPARDKNVVLFHVPPFNVEEAEAVVKRLVNFDDRDWVLRQYNPAKEFREARADWPYAHRIVGKYDSR